MQKSLACLRIFLFIFVDTSRNSVSEAFSRVQYTTTRIIPFQRETPSELAFHPRKAEDTDFLTPTQSFTLTEEEYRKENQSSTNDDDNNRHTAPETFLAEDRIRGAYREWCDFYGRSYDEKRLPTFASNFVTVENFHRQTKKSLVLNEFSDMTEREYEQHLATAAHFATPENIGPRSNDDSYSFWQEQTEVTESSDDPITSYFDPDPSHIGFSHVDEIRPPIPRSQTQMVHSSSSNNSNPVVPSEVSDASSSTDEVLSALQSTVSSLSTMVESMATATPPVAPLPAAQPLDSMVIDLLQQQDGSIAQLEESVEGLHEIQKQSSDLIELVSNNQKQMTEMMATVQSAVAALQEDQKQTEGNYALLLKRIEELEATVAKYDRDDSALSRSLVLSPATTTKNRRVEIKHNIPYVGSVSTMFNPFP